MNSLGDTVIEDYVFELVGAAATRSVWPSSIPRSVTTYAAGFYRPMMNILAHPRRPIVERMKEFQANVASRYRTRYINLLCSEEPIELSVEMGREASKWSSPVLDAAQHSGFSLISAIDMMMPAGFVHYVMEYEHGLG